MEKVCIKEDDMNYVIAVFSSRSETLSFANFLRRQSIPNAIVSTPKEAGRSCGLSVKFSYEYFAEVKKTKEETKIKVSLLRSALYGYISLFDKNEDLSREEYFKQIDKALESVLS